MDGGSCGYGGQLACLWRMATLAVWVTGWLLLPRYEARRNGLNVRAIKGPGQVEDWRMPFFCWRPALVAKTKAKGKRRDQGVRLGKVQCSSRVKGRVSRRGVSLPLSSPPCCWTLPVGVRQASGRACLRDALSRVDVKLGEKTQFTKYWGPLCRSRASRVQ